MSLRTQGLAKSLRENIPTIAVLLLLAAIAVWGIRNEWRIPFLSPAIVEEESESKEGPEAGESAVKIVAPATADAQQRFVTVQCNPQRSSRNLWTTFRVGR